MKREMVVAMTWLGAPLSIKLCSHDEMTPAHPITDVLLGHGPRLYMLVLHAPRSIIHSFRSLRGQFPRLRHLIVGCDNYRYVSFPVPQTLDTFEIAPELSYVNLTGLVSVLKPSLPITQLHELLLLDKSNWYTLDEFLQTLHDAPNLVKFSMNVDSSESQRHLPHTTVQHSNLRELRVRQAFLGTLIDHLTLTALVSLSCYGLASWPGQEFLSFLLRSSCSLHKLALDASFGDLNGLVDVSTSLAECLQHSPSLLELELLEGIGGVIDHTFWVALTNWPLLPCLVPKLQRIKVTRFFDFDYKEFVHMVDSRWRVRSGPDATHIAVGRIRSVEVCFMDDHDIYEVYKDIAHECQPSLACLRQFRAEGLNVIVPDMDVDDSSSESPDE
jgi:hypothetical protein